MIPTGAFQPVALSIKGIKSTGISYKKFKLLQKNDGYSYAIY